jgi:hypothetical protein
LSFSVNLAATLSFGQLPSKLESPLGRGHTKETSNRSFREMLTWVEHVELNGAAKIEETATQLAEDWKNWTPRKLSEPVFSHLCCSVVS